jgi:hypothetical protein
MQRYECGRDNDPGSITKARAMLQFACGMLDSETRFNSRLILLGNIQYIEYDRGRSDEFTAPTMIIRRRRTNKW